MIQNMSILFKFSKAQENILHSQDDTAKQLRGKNYYSNK